MIQISKTVKHSFKINTLTTGLKVGQHEFSLDKWESVEWVRIFSFNHGTRHVILVLHDPDRQNSFAAY